MITIMKTMFMFLYLYMVKNSNPIKMAIVLLILSTMMMIILMMMKSNIWMPTIFYMLFMGGILMMFMILSSLSPNEKSNKMKMILFPILILAISSAIINSEFSESNSNSIKTTIQSASTNGSITLMVLLYFLSFIFILSKMKKTLRTTLC